MIEQISKYLANMGETKTLLVSLWSSSVIKNGLTKNHKLNSKIRGCEGDDSAIQCVIESTPER